MSARITLLLLVACQPPAGAPVMEPEPVQPAARPPIPAASATGTLVPVASFYGAMPTGVAVSHTGRIFVCFPRWGDEVTFTVAEIVNGQPVPFPDRTTDLVSVQSVVVDAHDRLWALDTGSIDLGPPRGAKLVGYDLYTNRVAKVITFPSDVARPTSYLNDMRFDLSRGAGGVAYITDSSDKGGNGIVVVDLETGESWRRLDRHPTTLAEPGFAPIVEGHPLVIREAGKAPRPMRTGVDGIALSADGSHLYYAPLSGRHLYRVSTDLLVDQALNDDEVATTIRDLGEKCAGDGMESDAEGRVYTTCYEQDAIMRRDHDGTWTTIAADPHLLWPDTLALGFDHKLYVVANQLHRQPKFHDGRDLRERPYMLFSLAVAATPIDLKPRGEAPIRAASRQAPSTSW